MEGIDTFSKGKLNIFGLCKIRLRGSGSFEWNRVKVVRLGMQDDTDGYVGDGVGMVTKDEWFKRYMIATMSA